MSAIEPYSPLLHRLFLHYMRKTRHRGKDRAVKWFAKVFRPAPVIAVTSFGAYMRLDARDWVQYEILRDGVYEPQTIELLRRLLKAGDRFVDVGGNVGLHTLAAADVVGDSGKVIVLEPNPKVFLLLLQNLELNQLENVEPILAAVSNRTGLIRLFDVPDDSLGTGGEVLTPDQKGNLTAVFELAKLLECLMISSIDVVKIDVEGQEMKVLEGLFVSDTYFPSHIIFEFFPDRPKYGLQPRDLLSLLKTKGYEVLNILGKPYAFGDSFPEYNLWAKKVSPLA